MRLLSIFCIYGLTVYLSVAQQEYIKEEPHPGKYDCFTYAFTPNFRVDPSGLGNIDLDAKGNYKMLGYPSIKGTYKYDVAANKITFKGGFLATVPNEFKVLQDKKDGSKSYIIRFRISESEAKANKYGFGYLFSGEHQCFNGRIF